ncbi:hypothetical protein [Enterobacter genomosp. S]|uniref:MarR family transcriptional regulator n=1 Tax=Enterobacter genomosp. S TaxID=2364151 RepID=A0ABR5YS41_9ENTR|nr:hypothetical protein [Enterobacter genomosp. S]KZR34908.1 hypothetical protein A3466_17760 [Enterobacter genomosp. S]
MEKHIDIQKMHDFCDAIKGSQNFKSLVSLHEELVVKVYSRKPLFYKMVFKHERFLLALCIYGYHFKINRPTLKQIKKRIVDDYNLASPSTFSSFITMLHFTGRLELLKTPGDRRSKHFAVTRSVLDETWDLLMTMIKPYASIYRVKRIEQLAFSESIIEDFFSKYIDFIENDITIIKQFNELELFLNRDGGHMIILRIYIEYIRKETLSIDLAPKELASYASVSMMHINNILHSAAKSGLLSVERRTGIRINEKFVSLFENYFAFYLSQILYCMNCLPEHN